MARRDSSADDAGRNTRDRTGEAARHTSLWVERIARFGYSAKGVVYVVMGVLAVLAAVNAGGGHDGSERCLSRPSKRRRSVRCCSVWSPSG